MLLLTPSRVFSLFPNEIWIRRSFILFNTFSGYGLFYFKSIRAYFTSEIRSRKPRAQFKHVNKINCNLESENVFRKASIMPL